MGLQVNENQLIVNEKITYFKFNCDPTVISRIKVNGKNLGGPVNGLGGRKISKNNPEE